MYCNNCHEGDAEEYSLWVSGPDGSGQYELDVHLCDPCASDFLDLDWIEGLGAKADD